MVVRLLGGVVDSAETLPKFRQLCRRHGAEEKQGEKDSQDSMNHLEAVTMNNLLRSANL